MNQSQSDTSRSSGNSPMRWWVLAMAAIAVSNSYYESDVIGSVADLLRRAALREHGLEQPRLPAELQEC